MNRSNLGLLAEAAMLTRTPQGGLPKDSTRPPLVPISAQYASLLSHTSCRHIQVRPLAGKVALCPSPEDKSSRASRLPQALSSSQAVLALKLQICT
jgi:hypothetical protein